MAENKVKFGLKNVHYALKTVSESGAVTYGTPMPIPGSVNLTMDPQGETSTFYADDMAYYVTVNNDGYSGTLEIARIPDHFRVDVLKETLDATDKVLVENVNVEAAEFALLFEVNGDKKAERKLYYNCTVARPNDNGATTTASKEPSTDSLSITATPLPNGNVRAHTTAETSETAYNNWYTSVWQPAVTV